MSYTILTGCFEQGTEEPEAPAEGSLHPFIRFRTHSVPF